MSNHKASPTQSFIASRKFKALLLVTALTPFTSAYAQSTTKPAASSDDTVVVVTGVRASNQTSIKLKKNDNIISDVLSAEDIGGLPATNVGDAIATMSGAATNRAKGAASEIDLSGLGPFLATTDLNGRSVTTGNGTRSVNFYVFPSQLMNRVAIYKTQRADLIEGGTSGTLDMKTASPLDYKKRQIQLDVAGIYTGYDHKLVTPAGLDDRVTASYIDQFNLGKLGRLGVALGFQNQESNSPEEDDNSGTTWVACNANVVVTPTGTCSTITPQTYGTTAVPAGTPYYFSTTTRADSQMDTHEHRKGIIGALQWRANDSFEANLDVESSRYVYTEDKQFFDFETTTRGVSNVVYTPDHILTSYSGNTLVDSTPTYRIQTESYDGGGLNLAWQATSKLKLWADFSTANTKREREDRSVRLRSSATDIFGAAVPGVTTGSSGGSVNYTYTNAVDGTASIVLDPAFNANNPANYSAAVVATRTDQIRWNNNNAIRIDGKYDLMWGPFNDLKFGIRDNMMKYRSVEKDQRVWNFNVGSTASAYAGAPGTYNVLLSTVAAANQACSIPFPQSNFLGQADINTVRSWASFNALCLFNKFVGIAEPGPSADTSSPSNGQLREHTAAAYVMTDFASSLHNVPITGNFGLRYVYVRLGSYGLRGDFNVVSDGSGGFNITPVGTFKAISDHNKYADLLPSLNVSFDITDQFKVRTGIYRSLTKPDPFSLTDGRTFVLNTGTSFPNVASAISSITATGNPQIGPLLSWNEDVSLEYYANSDSMFSAHLYHKAFEGGYINTLQNESYTIGGQSFVVPVTVLQSTNQQSTIDGYEFSATYRASKLPTPFNGLGFKLNYSHADSNYQQQDLRLGTQVNLTTGVTYPALVDPVSIFGLSKNVVSFSPYFQYHGFEIAPVYKFRSDYYQQFIGAPAQNRVIRGEGVWDIHLKYAVNDHTSLFFDGTNITDTPQVEGQPVAASWQQTQYYGSTYYAGVHFKY